MTRESIGWVIAAFAVGLWLAMCAGIIVGEIRIVHSAQANSLVERLSQAEGFRGDPYDDTRGNPTLGYGTKLPITKAEGRLLLVHRLELAQRCIAAHWKPWRAAGGVVRDVLSQMVYQLGCGHLIEFDDMLGALARKDYAEAHRFGLQSVWARDFPTRAQRVLAPLLK